MSRIDGDRRDQALRFSRRAFTRTFVHMDKRLKAAPNKKEYEKLKKAGRVKEIAFTKNHTSGEIEHLLLSHFPTLVSLDLSRLRFISSYDRGHAMSVVFRGVPDGEEIMQEFGGDAKKKVFLYWKPGSSTSNPPASVPSSAMVPSLSSPPSTGTSSSLSSTTPSVTVPSLSTSSSTAVSSSATTSSITAPSSSASAPSSTGSLLTTQGSSVMSLSVPASPLLASNTVTVTSAPVTTTSAQISLPSDGRETRRYLTALAQSDNADGTALTDDDGNILHST